MSKFSLGVFGFSLHLKNVDIKPFHEMLIHLSGPAVNVIIASVFLASNTSSDFFLISSYINVLLAFFNLLPVFPLDGGKMINIFIIRLFSVGVAYKISVLSSDVFSFSLFISGILLIQYSIFNIMLVPIALNIYNVSQNEADYLIYKMVKKHIAE